MTSMKSAGTRAGDNVDRLRGDIDAGRTGDKVRVEDPAAAPLGTDAEAAGSPPAREEVGRARRLEIGHGQGTGQGRDSARGILLPAALVAGTALAAAAAIYIGFS